MSLTDAWRCSSASRERAETGVGTASTVRNFLLVESPGPWGVRAPQDARLPEPARAWLMGRRDRVLLIRRATSTATGAARIFRARGGRVTTAVLDSLEVLPEVDLDRDLRPHEEDLYLVCTHGRHDACCAERGRPVWAELERVAPEESWQVSHIGGDRFAANVLVLPDGLYYGQLEPDEVAAFVDTHRRGELALDHLRGRCELPFAAQAAEVFLRQHLDLRGRTPMRVLDLHENHARFGIGDQAWTVYVVRRETREQQTCRSGRVATAWTYDVGSITQDV